MKSLRSWFRPKSHSTKGQGTYINSFERFVLRAKLFKRELTSLKHLPDILRYFKQLNRLERQYRLNVANKLEIKNGSKVWLRAFKRFLVSEPSKFEIARHFFECDISIIRRISVDISPLVTMICVVKNDLVKVKESIKHHRTLGVSHFVILDNNSSDGLKDWALDQNDIDLMHVGNQYQTMRREAWINRTIAYFGFDRWYLVLDSDEMLNYSQMESHSIKNVINYCNSKNIRRMRGLMIDMYAEDSFYKKDDDSDFKSQCRYFDTRTYRRAPSTNCIAFTGGPRSRIFDVNAWLTKYPLFYFEEHDIHANSHYLYPYNKNFEACCIAILHYKFLPSDLEEYRKRVEGKSFFNGSKEYTKYVEYLESGSSDYCYSGSSLYKNSNTLLQIDTLTELFDEE